MTVVHNMGKQFEIKFQSVLRQHDVEVNRTARSTAEVHCYNTGQRVKHWIWEEDLVKD